MNRTRRRTVAWLGCAAIHVILAGCHARRGPEVVVYVAVDREQAEPLLARFEAETGLHVRAVYDGEAAKTSGLVTRLLAEAEHPRCDVFWNNELVQTCLLAESGVLEEYRSPAAPDVPAEFKDARSRWIPLAMRARVIVYNTKLVPAERVPKSIFDLTKPAWRGKVAMANPQFGTTRTHVAALFATLGADRAEQFLQDLLANDVRIVDGNATVKNLVARADPAASPILVGLTDTDDVRAAQAAGEPVDMVYPDQDSVGTLLVPCSVGLIHGAPHADSGRRLVDYLLGPEVTAHLTAAEVGYMPLAGMPLHGEKTLPEDSQGSELSGESIRSFHTTFAAILDELAPSSEWTLEHFHR